MRITQEEAEAIRRENGIGRYVLADEDKWEDEGKYSHKSFYFNDTNTGETFRLDVSRSGSYFGDYSYDYELDCPKVVLKTRTIVEEYWERVN